MMDGINVSIICRQLFQTSLCDLSLSWFFLNFQVESTDSRSNIGKKKTNKKNFFAWLSQKKYMFLTITIIGEFFFELIKTQNIM